MEEILNDLKSMKKGDSWPKDLKLSKYLDNTHPVEILLSFRIYLAWFDKFSKLDLEVEELEVISSY